MTTSISRLYKSPADAQAVVDDLQNAGIPRDDVSIITHDGDANDAATDAASGSSAGASIGAAVGLGAGLRQVSV